MHSAAKYGLTATDWRTQMCGLCLGLRDGHGGLARTATNTDATVLNALTEAQTATAPARTDAGPCPLRGMQRATVAAADAPGVQLATTASLLLGAAKIRDRVDDGDAGPLTRPPMRRISERWFAAARASAARIELDIEPLITAVGRQADIERAVELRRPADSDPDIARAALAELTQPTQLCASELFAHSAILANRPENAPALREAGWHFGRIAHLADAIEDLDDDRRRGRFNPLVATGVTTEQAHELLRESHNSIRRSIQRTGLAHIPTVRWLLLDPLHAVVRKLGRTAGVLCAEATHRCSCGKGSGRTFPGDTDGAATVRLLGFPSAPGSVPALPQSQYPHQPGPYPPGPTPGGYPPSAPQPHHPNPYGPQQDPYATPYDDPERRPYEIPPPFSDRPSTDPYPPTPGPPGQPPERPGFWRGLGIICGVYCTCYACCADHRRPCSGEHRDSWAQRDDCDCGSGCGDCCSGCGDCCDGCDCDCCDCDCSC